MNKRLPKSMGLILMTRQDLLNASLPPSLLDVGYNDEMWGRKMEVSATTPESRTRPSSSVEWLPSSYSHPPSPSPPPRCLRISPWPWRNDRPLNYLHRLIAADCNCRELFRLGWNCSLKGMEKCVGGETSVDHINYTLPMWSCSPILKWAAMEAQLYSSTMQSREWRRAKLYCDNRAPSSSLCFAAGNVK